MPRWIPIAASLALLAACEPDARNDANYFLERVSEIDLDDPIEDRRTRVDRLANLPLTATEVQEARDACVEGHRAVIEAETAQARARVAVDQHEGDEERLDITERQRIESDIRASNAALARSRELLPRCLRLTRDLQLRYRSRRARSSE